MRIRTTGAIWNEYLKTWPNGQYLDDVDITVNGEEEKDNIKSADLVVFTCGLIYDEKHPGTEPKSITRAFAAWLKTRNVQYVTVAVPIAELRAFRAHLKNVGLRELK